MFQSSSKRVTTESDAEINMAPLIDMIFILLIFFLVTAHFVPDEGVNLDRPQSSLAMPITEDPFRVAIAPNGNLYYDGQPVSPHELSREVHRFVATHSDLKGVVIPDKTTSSGDLVAAMDILKVNGIQSIAVMTQPKENSR